MFDETELSEFLLNPYTLDKNTLVTITEMTNKSPWCQLYQFLFLKNVYNTNPLEFEVALQKVIPFISDKKALYRFIYGDKENKGANVTDLIDRFIQNQPRINARRDLNTVAEVDHSEKATINKDSFISETLAKIYVNQENFLRAIKIYEQLSLKNPEKSSYFADQIKNIEEKIKNK